MKRHAKNLLTIFLVFALATSCAWVAYSQDSSEKAKQILEKTYDKYKDLLKKNGQGLKSMAAKMSIKGSGQMAMGGGDMPMNVDAVIELYAAKPHHLYLDISGNLGNAKIVVAGKEKVTATIILPTTKQFAVMDVPEETIQKMQRDDPKESQQKEELLKEVILAYGGTENTKAGKAHKIMIKPKDPSEEGTATVYILDGEWDPVRIEMKGHDKGQVVAEFEKLELNLKIPDEKFVADVKGYAEIDTNQLTAVIMMQIMGAAMQQGMNE
jgi:outer membrane lipoprotein-sorting protein